jgi:hypothetical protein
MLIGKKGLVAWIKSRQGIAFIAFLAVAAYFLWTEHRAHVVQLLPYVLLLLCKRSFVVLW